MHRSIFLIIASMFSTCAIAQYKCVGKDGSTSFQQTPCAAQAQQQKLEVKTTAPSTPVAPVKAASASLNSDQRLARDMERDRRVRELNLDIEQLQDQMARRNQQMASEMDALRAKKPLAKNNLAGATWEQSISQEMQAVAQKYKTMNDLDSVRLAQLQGDLAKIKQ